MHQVRKYVAKSSRYSGTIVAPASKSYLQRAIAIAMLTKGRTIIKGYSNNDDADAAIEVIRQIGADVIVDGNELVIEGCKNFNSNLALNCGESGLSTRMFAAIASLTNAKVILTGKGSILNRPMYMVEDALTKLGKKVKSNKGKLPLEIEGEIHGGEITIDGSESSQLLTGLLITLPFINQDSSIYVTNPKSIPYIQMTLDILKEFGIAIVHENYRKFEIQGNQKSQSTTYQVEGDWSGAAFHLVGAAISGQITITNLNIKSSQADVKILSALKKCGANLILGHDAITVSKNNLEAFVFDATDCPDLFPPLAVLAACCKGQSKILGVSRLKNKESNRGLTIQSEFKKIGIEILLQDDEMLITGGKVVGGKVNSHNDHRIAMAMVIIALVAENEIEIENIEAINKSYPNFLDDFERK